MFLICREQNHSGDSNFRAGGEAPEKLEADLDAAREYCRTAERETTPEEGMGNTTGFTVYRLNWPASDEPELVDRWDEDAQAFDPH